MWERELRNAWIHVHAKIQRNGRCTKNNPWTWKEFRMWFKHHLEDGVTLGIVQIDNNARLGCLRGMVLPNKAPF